MAIAPNPKRSLNVVTETQAENFISGNGKSAASEAASEDTGRKPIVIRVPADLLRRVDLAAKRKGISRSAFIVSSVADVVNGER